MAATMLLEDRLDDVCDPVSTFWRRSNSSSSNWLEWSPYNHSIHDEVDFTECFEDTVILWLISMLLFTFLLARCLCGRSKDPEVPFNYLNVAKMVLCICVIIPSVVDFLYTIIQPIRGNEVADYQFITPVVITLTMIMACVLILFERKVGIRSSGYMTMFWVSLVVYGSIKLRTIILVAEDTGGVSDVLRLVTFSIQLCLYILQLILVFIPEPKSMYIVLRDDERDPCPEQTASFLSRITWWWQNSLYWQGFKSPLVDADLCDLRDCDKSDLVVKTFEKEWTRRLKKARVVLTKKHRTDEDGVSIAHGKKGAQLSLIMALVYSFWQTFCAAGIFKLLQDLVQFVSPQILRLLVNHVNNVDEPAWRGYFYTVLLFVVAVIQSILLQQYFYRTFVTGMRVRTAVTAIVYRKALVLSNSARHTSTVGEIVNLMSVDTQRLMDLMIHLHMLWSSPLQIILSLVFLYEVMGPSIFAGFIVLIVLLPVNLVVFSVSSKYQRQKMSKKDARIKLINELLDGIKVIKLYAWEIPFKGLVSALRIQEVHYLKVMSYISAGSYFTWAGAPFLVALVTFATYSLVYKDDPDNRLTADKAFVALSLFQLLRFPLFFLPMLTSAMVQAKVTIKRLANYLYSDELDPECVLRDDYQQQHHASDIEMSALNVISVSQGSFTWGESGQPILNDIEFSVKPGELVAVVGQVGAGKSSLISALLGDMEKINGDVTMRGRVAYVPQQAWIQNATVKDNILFGKPLSGMLYDQTLHACALEQDLEILPGGDMTEIGEKGINLSGGQKQRVSLARSVYQEADVYLLDDPLSAVDSHVGKHIFDKVIGPDGMLKGKSRILVTHSISVLPRCDKILVMQDGRITEVGSYDQLMSRDGSKFAEFLQSYGSGNNESEADTPPSESTHPKDSEDNSIIKKSKTSSSGLTVEEAAETGSVKLSVLWEYLKACTFPLTTLTILFYALYISVSVGQNFWLAQWSNTETVNPNNTNLFVDLGVYSILGVVQILFVFLAAFSLVIGTIRGSRTLHSNMLANILRSPMSFFDTTPLGRILNRFSKDIDNVDEKIPESLKDFFITVADVVSTLIIISVASPWFLVVVVPLAVFYFLIQRFYVSTSRQLNRLQSVSLSPIFSHFRETINGASSIRAYGQMERFSNTSEGLVDRNNIAQFPIICSKRWLAVRLEFIGNLIILFAALFAILQRNYTSVFGRINPGLAGLSISYAIQVTQSLNWVIRMFSELESDIVAVERIKEYSETPTESDDVITDNRPSGDWPSEGHVRFDGYSTRYRHDLNLVLEDVSFDISAGQKVGIVGRTGAGKSSLTLALFRIIESARGAILIDGIDIATIGLRDLRSRITIIPQDPVLFSGTLRINLDPFDHHSDDEIWSALQTAHLSQFVNGLEAGLEHEISEGGENISVGQRQLVCLARALLRKTKILVLDEATAAVDMETDDLIQKTIRKEFANATVITIAHRLNTIMDYDRIMVLDNGRIAEFDTPNVLLESKGLFYGMARDAKLI